MIEKAKQFAREKHHSQLDDDGLDYFTAHVCQVAMLVRLAEGSENMIAAAYLHDVLEDTDTDEDELRAAFGNEITDLVLELTHEGCKDEYGYYFPRLKSREAIVIKLADRMSNLMRMTSWSSNKQEHYLRKTKFWKDGRDK